MAYNSKNYHKKAREIIRIYQTLKNPDKPDTDIVRNEFPKFMIFLSYRQWMNIKGTPIPKETPTNQLALFPEFDR